MKTNFLILTIFIIFLDCMQSAIAAQTNPIYINGLLPGTARVSTASGNVNSSINNANGTLTSAFTPAFRMSSNDPERKNLTLSVSANTSGTAQNAIFNIGTTKYIILTNSTTLPPVSSLTDIKTGTPTAANNPNAIAYGVNDPSNDTGNITITYQSTTKNWNLFLRTSRSSQTTLTVPASTPFTNTFSADDEAGDYKADVTLSFVCD